MTKQEVLITMVSIILVVGFLVWCYVGVAKWFVKKAPKY